MIITHHWFPKEKSGGQVSGEIKDIPRHFWKTAGASPRGFRSAAKQVKWLEWIYYDIVFGSD